MITVNYENGDRLQVEIRGHKLNTDQPHEDGGGDTAPTPTELFLGGLAACVAFYAERFLRRHGLPAAGMQVRCSYAWAENPHRVGEIQLIVDAPGLTPETRAAFERVVEHCTVHNTLEHPPAIALRVSGAEAAVAGGTAPPAFALCVN